jgi:hypothetical protein
MACRKACKAKGQKSVLEHSNLTSSNAMIKSSTSKQTDMLDFFLAPNNRTFVNSQRNVKELNS